MKEKRKNGCNILIMTFTTLEKYVYSKKCLKQRRQHPPPPPSPLHLSLQRCARYFRAEKVTWPRLVFAIEYAYPADRVTKRSVVHPKRFIPYEAFVRYAFVSPLKCSTLMLHFSH